MGTLHLARSGDGILQRLLEYLPEYNNGSQLERQARLALDSTPTETTTRTNWRVSTRFGKA